VGLIFEALKKEQESRIWERWVRLCPYMEIGKIKFITFDDYKKALLKSKVNVSVKTNDEIMAEFLPIISAHEKR